MSNGHDAYATSNIAQPGAHRTHAPRSSPSDKCCKPAPCACPACGGLECLCRPRFFAGQLLTEEDLNRLDHYIVEKHQLYNRYLHGWGVVCGLEVLCHPCENWATVTSGYALGPCGEDIVVCANETVDVCSLIKKCRDQERRHWQCEPCPPYREEDECEELTETWILSVRYDEKPSRGITPLRGSSDPCCSQCCCGGSDDCGCGCHEKQPKRQNGKGSCKPKPPQCEATINCEGYVFEVCRPAKGSEEEEQDRGSLVERFEGCVGELTKALPAGIFNQQTPATPQQQHEWCCQVKESLYRFFSEHPWTTCDWCERLRQIECPAPNGDPAGANTGFQAAFDAALKQFAILVFEYLMHCLCSALLPPCPDPVCDPRVPLASITVRKKDCRILKICNWTIHRKFAVTFPNLQHWLSWIPTGQHIRQLLEKLCCNLFGIRDWRGSVGASAADESQPSSQSFAAAYKASQPQAAARARAFSGLTVDAFQNRAAEIGPQELFVGMLGGVDDDGEPLLRKDEREHLPEFLMLNLTGSAVADAALPPELSALRGPAGDVTALRAELDSLKAQVQEQSGEIEQLNEKLDSME